MQTRELIARDFEIEPIEEKDQITEEELLRVLSDRIAYMIEYQLEFLLSLMYRLDVSEQKVSDALSPGAPEPANTGLARLVIERQKQRAFTKQFYKQEKLEDLDEELEF
jgi:hypothetical protein